MKLYFVADAIYDGEVIFEKGSVHEVTEDRGFAYRWIRRGIAVPAKDVPGLNPVEAGAVESQAKEVKEVVESKAQPSQDQKEAQGRNKGQSRNKDSRNKTQGSDLL